MSRLVQKDPESQKYEFELKGLPHVMAKTLNIKCLTPEREKIEKNIVYPKTLHNWLFTCSGHRQRFVQMASKIS